MSARAPSIVGYYPIVENPHGTARGNVLPTSGTPEPEIIKDLLVAEYTNLRQEQFGRTIVQQGVLGFNFTVAAAIGTVVLTQANNGSLSRDALAYVSLIIPAVAVVSALEYLGQHQSILACGHCVRDVVAPKAKELGGIDVFEWESYIRRRPRSRVDETLGNVSMPLLAGGPAVATLSASFNLIFLEAQNSVAMATWLLELVSLVGVGALWLFGRSR